MLAHIALAHHADRQGEQESRQQARIPKPARARHIGQHSRLQQQSKRQRWLIHMGAAPGTIYPHG